jgi:hypothetical protein
LQAFDSFLATERVLSYNQELKAVALAWLAEEWQDITMQMRVDQQLLRAKLKEEGSGESTGV